MGHTSYETIWVLAIFDPQNAKACNINLTNEGLKLRSRVIMFTYFVVKVMNEAFIIFLLVFCK